MSNYEDGGTILFTKYLRTEALYNIEKMFANFDTDFGLMNPNTFRDEVYDEKIKYSNVKPAIIAAYYFYYFIKTNSFSNPTYEYSTAHHIVYKFTDGENRKHKFWFDTDHNTVTITLAYDIWLKKGTYEEVTKRFVEAITTKSI